MIDLELQKRSENAKKSKTLQNIIKSLSLDTKAVLDIGCSYGESLACFGTGSTGITLSEDEAAYAVAQGLDSRIGNIEEEHFSLTKTYDAIFANNLFEHLYSPHGFLIKIKEYMRPDGVLILGVPCIPKIVSLLHVRKFRGSLANAHINFFTRDTLVKTVERAGWTVHSVRSFHISNRTLDKLLDLICPHFYVVATKDPASEYSEKRMKELKGYKSLAGVTE
jgi:cyclopropane fatty-acyl-phospholipid synthase-like methyltransferase